MKGKFGLTIAEIDSVVTNTAGTYILVNSNNNAVYVGRSDTDLNKRLKEHLPENEKELCIKRSDVTYFYFENANDPQGAYLLECEWYHNYRPTCNIAHPAKISAVWICPICRL